MGRFFITGDKHGEIEDLVMAARILDEEDTLIVLGDFGFIWDNRKQEVEKELKAIAERCRCQIAFVDGNHENFNQIAKMEDIVEWNGGKVGLLPYGIIHLLRGEVYNLNDEKVAVIGGADSVDKMWRTPGLGWWEQETTTVDDADKLIANAEGKTDLIVLSHDAPSQHIKHLKFISGVNSMADYSISQNNLQKVADNIDYKKWYFAHWHIDRQLDEKFECLYHNIEELA